MASVMKNQSSNNNLLITNSHQTESVRKCSDPIIPVDLLIDIFSRLSAKPIARFRCVSKFWAYVLGRPDFTELFLSKSRTRPRLFFALEANGKLLFYSTPQPHNLEEDSCLVVTRYHGSYPEHFPSVGCTPVYGLALLGLCQLHPKRLICNPATGEFTTLPDVILNLPVEEKATSYPDEIASFHFGYDPMGKQFKVLCMTTSSYKRPNTHMVLTLETGKSQWRNIKSKFHFVGNYRIMGEICINGVMYFGADFDRSTVIVSFDFKSEKFGFINTIEYMSLGFSYTVGSLVFFNYKGKLGIYRNNRDWIRELVFWVLEDAANHKWSKYVYALFDLEWKIVKEKWFVGMTGTGEMVWSPYPGLVYDPFYLFFYNLERKSFTRVNIQGFKEFKENHHIRLHTFLDYVENVIKNNTWSQHKHTRQNRAPAKEEKHVSNNRKTKIQNSIPTSNRFDILGSLGLAYD